MVGEVIADRYELGQVVGTGGMSSVFRAHDRLLERDVALKVLHERYSDDAEYVARFRREARAVAQLSHPNIVTVIDRGADDGRQYIVFEYVDGESLKQLVGRSGRLPVRRATKIAAAIAEAIAYAHAHGLVHRDVKPQNVLLSEEGEVRVTDFGIARSLDVERELTQAGTVLGTSNYISPEQASGQPATPATDVYSLGIVLYELLAGTVPFPGDDFAAVAFRHVNEEPPDLAKLRPDVPPRLAAVVHRALAKKPELRFHSMDELARELRRCLAELDAADTEQTLVGAAAAPAIPRPGRSRRRLAWGLALVSVLVAAGVGAAILDIRGSGEATTGLDSTRSEPVAPAEVSLRGVTAYDPYGGDGWEHDGAAPKATDGHKATFWTTSTYRYPNGGLGKKGVGLVVGAGRPVALKTLTVTSDTPGFTASILAGAAPKGPFRPDSSPERVGAQTTFALRGASARYYVVWITNLGRHHQIHVNEVSAR